MRYVAGMDGGGTKTAVAIAEESGRILHRFESGAINVNGQDEAAVAASLCDIFATIASVCGDLDLCVHLCIGAAGVSNPHARERLLGYVRAGGFRGEVMLVGDHETALVGAHGQRLGIILIAGTGSICYGINEQSEEHRTGGYGHLIDDGGSGYSIGRDLLSACVQVHDGRVGATVIPELVYGLLGLTSIEELIRYVYYKQRNKREIAALAPLLTYACSQGDSVALSIAQRNASALFELVVPVAERLDLRAGELAWAGGILLHNRFILNELLHQLEERFPAMRSHAARQDAAYGAVHIALERHRWQDERRGRR